MSYIETVRPESPSIPETLARVPDRVLFGLVLRYREHPSSANAQEILVFVGETMRGRANRYKPVPPVISRADIRQALVVAVLETAATFPLRGHEFLERRLMLRAANRTWRALRREMRTQDDQDDFSLLDGEDEEEDVEDV